MNVTLAKELCELGEVALAAGDSARAIYHYTQAIEAQADCAEAWFGRGRAHADSEAWPKAVDDLTHALRLNPEDLGVRINRPMALAGAGRIQEAQSEWDALVRHESSYIGCWLGRV